MGIVERLANEVKETIQIKMLWFNNIHNVGGKLRFPNIHRSAITLKPLT